MSFSPQHTEHSSAVEPRWTPPSSVLLQSVASARAPSGFHLLDFHLLCCERTWAGLDDGVPVKIILDVIGWHAMHLEVSRRYHVLLVHLCMMSWRGNRRQRVHNCGTEAEQTFLHPFLRHLSLWAQWCSLGACGDILEDPSWTYSVWSPCRDFLHEKQPKRIYLSHADQQIKERFTHFFYYSYYLIQ